MKRIRVAMLVCGVAACAALFLCTARAQSKPLDGVIDIHVHTAPDSVARSIDAIDLARLAESRGMRAIVLKNHYAPTAADAYLVQKVVPGIQVFGGIDLNLSVGGSEREAYEAMRTRIERVVIQAFCFDDKDVPHPASQVAPERDVDEAYEGEIYRCIAGSHMQVTIAPFRDQISFEGGQTLTCQKGEALWHEPGKGAGKLECRPQKPARDCNERSLLRRFGAGIKVLTLIYTEKYTAFREDSHQSASVVMSLDGGVGGVAY